MPHIHACFERPALYDAGEKASCESISAVDTRLALVAGIVRVGVSHPAPVVSTTSAVEIFRTGIVLYPLTPDSA